MKYFIEGLKKYAVFKGRATRSEYWYFVLFTVLLIGLSLYSAVGLEFEFGFALYLIILLGTLLPGLAVFSRRMHDIGKSGTYIFFYLIPFGGIYLIVLLCKEGEPFRNKYGPDPQATDITFDFEENPPLTD